jgi:hypothetical protein
MTFKITGRLYIDEAFSLTLSYSCRDLLQYYSKRPDGGCKQQPPQKEDMKRLHTRMSQSRLIESW